MLIQGSPITPRLPDEFGIGERFWYWRGASGCRYIHSIYAVDACPPLPGAVYVAVKRTGGARQAVAVGRFSSFWDGSVGGLADSGLAGVDADEIHVHLLARDNLAAQAVFSDLYRAFLEFYDSAARQSGLREAEAQVEIRAA